jgi:hypothetical protein
MHHLNERIYADVRAFIGMFGPASQEALTRAIEGTRTVSTYPPGKSGTWFCEKFNRLIPVRRSGPSRLSVSQEDLSKFHCMPSDSEIEARVRKARISHTVYPVI